MLPTARDLWPAACELQRQHGRTEQRSLQVLPKSLTCGSPAVPIAVYWLVVYPSQVLKGFNLAPQRDSDHTCRAWAQDLRHGRSSETHAAAMQEACDQAGAEDWPHPAAAPDGCMAGTRGSAWTSSTPSPAPHTVVSRLLQWGLASAQACAAARRLACLLGRLTTHAGQAPMAAGLYSHRPGAYSCLSCP